LLTAVTRASVRRPGLFVLGALVVLAVSIALASGLQVKSSFEELLPPDVPSVRNIRALIQRVGGDGTVLVVVECLDGPAGLPAAEDLARSLAREILALGPSVIRSVEWNEKEVARWFEDHWPLFASVADLKAARDAVIAETARAQAKANPLALDLSDPADAADPPPKAPEGALALIDPGQPSPRARIEQRFARYPDGFLVHPDGRSLTLVVRPAGTSLGVDGARALLDLLRKLAGTHREALAANHLRIGFGGTFPVFVAEYETILHDVGSTAALVITLVLLSLFLFFRDVRSTAALAASVLVAVAATFGITRLTIGFLNTQTAFLGSIVVGNGINYGLIYLARVAQLRRRGVALEEACVEGAQEAAQATLLASAASSVSFAMLIFAGNRGFRDFGYIGGTGMLLCWLCTFLFVPAWLSLFERLRPVRGATAKSAATTVPPPWMRRAFARPRAVVVVFVVLSAVSAVLFVRRIPDAIERNLENLTNEIKGEEELIRDNTRGNQALGKSVAGAVALLHSRDAADAFCAVVRERLKDQKVSRVVQGCDTLSSVVPRDQEEKLGIIRDILRRLDGPWVRRLAPAQRARLAEVRADLRAQRPIDVSEAPPALLDRFRERDGNLGRLAVVTALPDAKLELAPNLALFVAAVRGVPVEGRLHDASGENVVFADLLANINREGPRTTFLSLLGVCALVMLFFARDRRGLRMSLEVIASLITGVVLMGGAATLLGIRINFFNFIVFPITFGIAVDYGVNVIARVRERGGDVLGALVEVGAAVALCSWTSIIGYGSLLIALNRALRSFGWYAMVGEVMSIVTALVMLPALALLVWGREAQPRGQGTESAVTEGGEEEGAGGKGDSPGLRR
jgi:predicted RND superfamily exporter protein